MFDDQGLTAIDRRLRADLIESLSLSTNEVRGLTKWLCHWHKDWGAVLRACQKDFNLMRRMQCADDDGMCVCVSTGERQHYKKMDAGHFIDSERDMTRFDSNNVWPQTKQANNHNHGDDAKINYTIWMIGKFDVEFIRELQGESKIKYSWKDNQDILFEKRVYWKREIKKQETRLCQN